MIGNLDNGDRHRAVFPDPEEAAIVWNDDERVLPRAELLEILDRYRDANSPVVVVVTVVP